MNIKMVIVKIAIKEDLKIKLEYCKQIQYYINMKDLTLFKLKIANIDSSKITFDIKVGTKPQEVFTTIYTYGYGFRTGNLTLTHKAFSDFTHRLVAYVFTEKQFNSKLLNNLWDLKLNIMDSENPKKAKSIFGSKFIKYVKNNS